MALIERLQNFARRYPDVTGPTLLLGLVIAVFWPLLNGQALFFGDLELYFYPVSEFWRRQFSSGILPLWNPHLFGGVSYVGNPQIVSLYPLDMLLWWLPTYTAHGVSAMLHLWASGACFFLWMRHGRLRLSSISSLLGAVCWMLGGAFVTKTQFPNMLSALAYLPAVLWGAEGLARQPSVRTATVLGSVMGLQLLAAHAQISLFTFYFALAYSIYEGRGTSRPQAIRIALGWAFALALAALLDAGQLLPVAETLRGAERQALSLQGAELFYLPIWAVTHLFIPYLYGNPNVGTWTYKGGGNSWETACYLGVLPFLFSLSALRRGRFWTASALVCLTLALGLSGGLFLLAYYIVPGIARFRNAARFLMPAGFALAVLAAQGFEKFKSGVKARNLVPLVLLLCVLDLSIYARTFYPLRNTGAMVQPKPDFISNDLMLRHNQARIWTANPKKARSLLVHYEDFTRRTPEYDAQFPVGSIPDTHIWSGLMEAEGYDPIAPAIVASRLKALEIPVEATAFPQGYETQLGAANIRLLALWRKNMLPPTAALKEVYRGTAAIGGQRLVMYLNEACLPRARVWKYSGNGISNYDGGWDAGIVTSPSINRLAVTVPSSNQFDQSLEIADNFAPGWRAFENGLSVPIGANDAGFIEVGLKEPSQARKIDLVYEPESYRLGVFIMLCALSAAIGVFFATKKPETR